MLKVDKKIKEMPWPEPYSAEMQRFRVTLSWPIIDHERLLVATFSGNANKVNTIDFRLICSKKQNKTAILYRGSQKAKREELDSAIRKCGTSSKWCYPEISEADEKSLGKWLGATSTDNHMIPELQAWTRRAVQSEILAERDARGELRDEDVDLCPEELPADLVQYIRTRVIPEDRTLIYKKGNTRGICFQCGRNVRATGGKRFRQSEVIRCPECGSVVTAYLETSDRFKVDYVQNIATIQKGTDGKTLFIRQWHILRDMTAQWEDIPGQLQEIARYGIRGNKVARWQKETKSNWYWSTYRERLDKWSRVKNDARTYDGSYYFHLPLDWETELEGTSLQFCDLQGYMRSKDCKSDLEPIRLLMDWARYPSVEKLWKAGYRQIIHDRERGMFNGTKNTILWSRGSMREALRFPVRLLKLQPPGKWTLMDCKTVTALWDICRQGKIRESDIETLFRANVGIDMIGNALGHASVGKILRYVKKIRTQEREAKEKLKKETLAAGKAWYEWNHTPKIVQTYRDYLRDLVKLEVNMDDEIVLFPRDLEAAHQRTIVAVKYKSQEIHNEKVKKRAEALSKLAWERDGLIIRPAADAEELVREGAALDHCVAGYAEDVAQGKTAIFVIRLSADPDKPFYTMEWRGDRVIQCRTEHNKSYEADPAVMDFVDAWKNRTLKKTKKQTANVA